MHTSQVSPSLHVQIINFFKLNLTTIILAIFSLSVWKTAISSIGLMKEDKSFNLINVFKAFWNMLKHEKLVFHKSELVYNSFLPPLNSPAIRSLLESVPFTSKQDIFQTHISAKRSAPLSMYIAITKQCPYKCWHCSANAYMQKDSNIEFNHCLKNLEKLIAKLQEMKTPIIGLTGGEPMTREDIFDIVGLIDDRSKSILFTNGYNLNYKNAVQLANKGLWAVGISLDTTDEKEFNKIRGFDNAFENSINAIKACKDAGLYTMIQTVATKDSIKSKMLEELAFFANSLQVDEIRILETYPMGKLSTQQNVLLNNEERKYLYEFHVNFNQILSYSKIACFAYIEHQSQFGCGAGVQHSYIDPDGNLRPCDFVPLNFGNVYQKDVKVLWQEMNDSMGFPHKQCFSLKFNKQIQSQYQDLQDPEKAKDFCKNCKDSQLPLNYRLFAGQV